MGFNFDLINYRRLYLPTLDHQNNSLKLIANIYPGATQDFIDRRTLANKIRTVKHDVELTYLPCADFMKNILSRELF